MSNPVTDAGMMKHQEEGVRALSTRAEFALFDEPGIGKSRQVIEAANFHFVHDHIDLVLIVCPAQVIFNWFDQELGEIGRWSIRPVRAHALGSDELWSSELYAGRKATYLICSYEWLRSGTHAQEVATMLKGQRAYLVCDESSFVRNRKTKQFKAVLGPRYGRIKKHGEKKWSSIGTGATRCVILNGTPVANCVSDLWAQFYVIDKKVLDCTFWQFREKHCVMGGWMKKEVVAYRDLDGKVYPKKEGIPPLLLDSLSPYVLCRRKRDVLDLPKLTQQVVTVPLDPETWSHYKRMREEFLTWLDSKEFTAANAAVKVMRLAQLCNGFLTESELDPVTLQPKVTPTYLATQPKAELIVEYLKERAETTETPIIVWCWWRAQIFDLEARLKTEDFEVYTLHGTTKKADKDAALNRFHPGHLPYPHKKHRVVLLAQHAAGGMGLNLSAADESLHASSSHSFILREQADGRIDRPGQKNPMTIKDVIATGPKGQKTVEDAMLRARRSKEDLSTWTKDRWRKSLG